MEKNFEDSMRRGIYVRMRQKETDELLQIWTQNDRSEWTDAAFSVIEEILSERLGDIPPQAQKQLQEQIDNPDSLSSLAAAVGGVLIVAGIALAIGNMSGAFPTFPYVGFFTQFIGWAIIAASKSGQKASSS